MSDMSLIRKTATEIRALLSRDEVSPLDLLDALETRVAEVEPKINALPTLCFERARDCARALMSKPREERGILMGMPVAIKDLEEVKGVRDHLLPHRFLPTIFLTGRISLSKRWKRMVVLFMQNPTRRNSALVVITFNDVLGTTLNPWNLERSVAGSPADPAAALVSGTAWLAQGSDIAVRFVIRPVFVQLSACGQVRAVLHEGQTAHPSPLCRLRDRWRGMWPMWR